MQTIDDAVQVLLMGKSGVNTIDKLLPKVFSQMDLGFLSYESFPSRIEGGIVTGIAKYDAENPHAFSDHNNVAVIFDYESYLQNKDLLGPETVLLLNTGDTMLRSAMEGNLPLDEQAVWETYQAKAGINFNAIASTVQNDKSFNMAALGALMETLGMPHKQIRTVMEKQFQGKKAKFLEPNLQAYDAGAESLRIQKEGFDDFPVFNLPEGRLTYTQDDMLLDGNWAIGLAAYMAGVRFSPFYPITPATDIVQFLMQFKGVQAPQVEDELAAVNQAIGYAHMRDKGKTMLIGSGPTASLISEGRGLAEMLESSLLYVNVMRGATPSTSLPTGYGQADLDWALRGGHGSLGVGSTIVAAAANPEDAFNLTVLLSGLARHTRSFATLLTDQSNYVTKTVIRRPKAKSVRALNAEVLGRMGIEEYEDMSLLKFFEGKKGRPRQGMNFSPEKDGIPFATVPGQKTAVGTLETGLVHKSNGGVGKGGDQLPLASRLVQKLDFIRDLPSELLYRENVSASNKRIAVVGWGTTEGAIIDAVNLAREQDIDVDRYHGIMLSHLPEEFFKKIDQYDAIIVPEANFSGQFSNLLSSKGIDPMKIFHYKGKLDGKPFKVGDIFEYIKTLDTGITKIGSGKFSEFREAEEVLRARGEVRAQLDELLTDNGLNGMSLDDIVNYYKGQGSSVKGKQSIDKFLDELVLKAQDYASPSEVTLCPGCGDNAFLAQLKGALVNKKIDPSKYVIVSGIGCSGRLSLYMNGYSIHGIHGRALPIARGIALADPDLTVIAIMGDNDAYAIGGGHLGPTARMNPANLTAFIMDNGICGLTKGQRAATTKLDKRTSTTQWGNIMEEMYPLEFLVGNSVGHIFQTTMNDGKFGQEQIIRALDYDGFAVGNVIVKCKKFAAGRFDDLIDMPNLYVGGNAPKARRKGPQVEEIPLQNMFFRLGLGEDWGILPPSEYEASETFPALGWVPDYNEQAMNVAHAFALGDKVEYILHGTLLSKERSTAQARYDVINGAKQTTPEIFSRYALN